VKKTIIVFAALIVALLALFQISKYSIISGDTSVETIISIVAIIFFFIGVYINKRSLNKSRQEVKEIDTKEIERLEITKREYEVLLQINSGLSNKEIAEKLFVSESTIKTHVSNLLIKLNAKRRTQALQVAKQKNII
jgi:DNA-binding NarL/FixJ family response regulator